MPKTILLTGAAGFVGRHLLEAARTRESEDLWLAVDHAEPPQGWGRPRRVVFKSVDLGNLSQTQQLVAGANPHVIVHLAGSTAKSNSQETRDIQFRSNLHSTCNMLHALRTVADPVARPPHFIIPSTGLVYGNQQVPFTEDLPLLPTDGGYGLFKFLAEEALHTYARSGIVGECVLRPAIIYGPGQGGDMFIPSLISTLRQGRRFSMTAGAQTRDFVFVADMVQALLLAIDSELTGTFNIGTGAPVALREVGELVAKLMGCPDLLGLGEFPYREQEVWSYALDASRLRAAGWTANTALDEGIRRTIEWERKYP
jgi:nucleoside-diphosphate-sugar epimerase